MAMTKEEAERLATVEARAEKATPLDWHTYDTGEEEDSASVFVLSDTGRSIVEVVGDWPSPAREDADFIAAARSDVPWLAALCRRLAGRVEALEGALKRLERSSRLPLCDTVERGRRVSDEEKRIRESLLAEILDDIDTVRAGSGPNDPGNAAWREACDCMEALVRSALAVRHPSKGGEG